ncbi:MAG: aminotransferase [Gammaproteobacteria bacterium 28-57-27]|nr:MAG: aminotransferase [Gammaproteobacteria bacterium 28-57-27]
MTTRRDFLKLGGGAAALSMVAACQPAATENATKDVAMIDSMLIDPKMIDFGQSIDRQGTDSVKWDGRAAIFGTDDVVPLWVADMDFASPPAVRAALVERAAHPVYGYTQVPERLYDSLIGWQKQRHGWEVERDWAAVTPGVVPVLYAAVRALTRAGEGVIVQPPVYTPFFSAVTENDRRLMLNPLREQDGHYSMDFDNLEQCARDGGKLLLLCSPHNPVGRVWRRDELQTLLDIARKHDLIVVSDEIHADLVYAPNTHIPLAMLEDMPERVMTVLAPSKSFNIPGMGLAFMLCGEPELRSRVRAEFTRLHIESNNPFSLVAAEAAYRHGAGWLDVLMHYLAKTQDLVLDYCAAYLPGIRALRSEGTFLMWLDCRALAQARGLDDRALLRLLVEKAKVGMSSGVIYGQGGEGFMRLNIGAPRQVIMDALERIKQALTA